MKTKMSRQTNDQISFSPPVVNNDGLPPGLNFHDLLPLNKKRNLPSTTSSS